MPPSPSSSTASAGAVPRGLPGPHQPGEWGSRPTSRCRPGAGAPDWRVGQPPSPSAGQPGVVTRRARRATKRLGRARPARPLDQRRRRRRNADPEFGVQPLVAAWPAPPAPPALARLAAEPGSGQLRRTRPAGTAPPGAGPRPTAAAPSPAADRPDAMSSPSAAATSRSSSSRASTTQSSSSSCSRSPRHKVERGLGLTLRDQPPRPPGNPRQVIARERHGVAAGGQAAAEIRVRAPSAAPRSRCGGWPWRWRRGRPARTGPPSRDRGCRPGWTASQPSSARARLLAGQLRRLRRRQRTSSSPITRMSSMACGHCSGGARASRAVRRSH